MRGAVSLEICVICDKCGKVIAGAKTGAEARRDAREQLDAKTALPGGMDFCGECSAVA
jgi:hypothetical protein